MPFRALAAAAIASACFAQAPDEFRISTNVDHVVLPVTVTDRKGEFIPGLNQDSFQVYEDGKPQVLSFFSHKDVPLTVGIVVDSSGSMRPKRPDAVLAALHFVRLSNPEDEVFTITFNEKVSFGLPEDRPFTSNAGLLRDSLLEHPCTGRTALYDALGAGLERLAHGTHDKKALIVVSDGGDNASRRTFDDVLAAAERSNAILYTIGLFDSSDDDRNPGVLKKLARQTGGEMYLPERTAELADICAHIARDLRTQYTLAYSPTNEAHDGAYRRVRVAVSAPGAGKLTARTRPGYYAPSSQPQQARSTAP